MAPFFSDGFPRGGERPWTNDRRYLVVCSFFPLAPFAPCLLCSFLGIFFSLGAGKTTLLNALSGRATYARVTGNVSVAGRPLTAGDLDYVPQFDDVDEFFTTRELLEYTSILKVE